MNLLAIPDTVPDGCWEGVTGIVTGIITVRSGCSGCFGSVSMPSARLILIRYGFAGTLIEESDKD